MSARESDRAMSARESDRAMSAQGVNQDSTVCLVVHVTADRVEAVSDRLWALGTTGVEERDGVPEGGVDLVAGFADAGAFAAARRSLVDEGESVDEWTSEPGWRDRWRDFTQPAWLSPTLVVAPPWLTVEASAATTVIEIDPGYAFGDGRHPTTASLALLLSSKIVPGTSVLDVGCGGGVLSIVAAKAGAVVTSIDIDPAARRATELNAEANGVADRVTISARTAAELTSSYGLIVANLPIDIIEQLSSELTDRAEPGATLLVSGFLVADEPRLCATLPEFDCVTRQSHGGWLTVELRKTGVTGQM